ncbi:Uncharacterised protein [Legionella steigerwaltii]|uniref:Uncharacterized protein n=1 Tax=Legionella steigerwaltii TaxID=460 RepID=A0A378L4M2_9GAMM|nr:hypothetical protein [Legionella steigerwaltii]KTD71981.1 hypothetical protein Lstg_2682 [Legionella steigerwaltii]STY21647.1 Uncharacterised protein [Legionella steigerwaltii]
MSRIYVIMDSGGAISVVGSGDEHFTDGFGGCTAFYARTASGEIYALYHLSSTLDRAPEMVEGVTDSNEPFRNWIRDLKEQSAGQKVHFYVGTPWLFGDNEKVEKTHPQLGMERYLRKICAQQGLEDFDITLLNMIDVESISITQQGMMCYGYNGKEIGKPPPAQYQTDEEILEHLGWTNQRCLQFIKADPNIDFDGKLFKKYAQRCTDDETIKQKVQAEAKQKEMEHQQKEMIAAITQPLLVVLGNMVTKYQKIADESRKGNSQADFNFLFVKELLKATESRDLQSLQEMKTLDYFKQVTEKSSLVSSLFSKERTELGKLFYKAENILAYIQELSNEEASTHASSPSHGPFVGNSS